MHKLVSEVEYKKVVSEVGYLNWCQKWHITKVVSEVRYNKI